MNSHTSSRSFVAAFPARLLALCLVALLSCILCSARSPEPPQSAAPPPASQASREAPSAPQTYSLTPERAAQAVAYARARHILYFASFAWQLLGLLLVLRLGIAASFRDAAERAAKNRFLQAAIFAPALLLALDLWSLATEAAGHALAAHFGQSIQGWGSWLADQAKGEALNLFVGIFLVWLLYAVMRRSPRRWWFYAWLGAIPIMIFFVFVTPLVVEPLFFRFTPLAATQPDLAAQIERVVTRAGQDIPENRMFVMNASSKLNAINAYVTGIGASRRVVVWDTTVARMTTPEILFVFGHELGHYVLGHIEKGIAFAAALLLAALFAGFHLFRWCVARYARAWRLRGADDWASLPALLLVLALFGFVLTPAANAFSRYIEHQADQFGLEVTRGIVPDVPAVAAQAFQVLGEADLEEPAPSALVKFWFYDHPPLEERIAFARSYDPWSKGESPRFVK